MENLPVILTCPNHARTDDYTDEHTQADAVPNLAHQSLVHSGIVLWAEGLLEERKEYRDDNAGLKTLAEADEEDCSCWSGYSRHGCQTYLEQRKRWAS
jgi:hypothetical protein